MKGWTSYSLRKPGGGDSVFANLHILRSTLWQIQPRRIQNFPIFLCSGFLMDPLFPDTGNYLYGCINPYLRLSFHGSKRRIKVTDAVLLPTLDPNQLPVVKLFFKDLQYWVHQNNDGGNI